LSVRVDEIEVADTGQKIHVESADETIPIFSRAEHVKILLRGSVKDLDMSSVEHVFAAYAFVRPPVNDEIWYVQRRERDNLTTAGRFEVEAYLGGKGLASAQHSQRFGVVILIADFETRDTYSNLSKIPMGRPLSPTYRLETVRKAIQQTNDSNK
jgi:hypothetical protein